MKECVDYLVVGSGLTGATIARLLADAGRQVLVIERRSHWGGNVHDSVHASGIRVHSYGPHYFRTNSPRIWRYVNRFATFYPFEATLKSFVDGAFENWPLSASYIARVVGADWQPEFQGTPQSFEQACLARMPRIIYDKFVRGYTEKQWGIPAHELSASLAKRFDVRRDDDQRLSRDQYQGLPENGYTAFMEAMLAGIPRRLNTNYLERRDEFAVHKKIVFTGPIDEFFGFDLGRLTYRAQNREHLHLPQIGFAQPTVQVNNPDPSNGAHIRTIEWKHLMPAASAQEASGTVLTRETPYTPTNPDCYEYPFPDAANAKLYAQYRRRAQAIPNLLICGRLGEYRYFDMDQAIGRAMMLAERLLADK
jgi:UDP-galactopyranose mutase